MPLQEPRSLFLHPLHRVFSCPLRQTRPGFFSTSVLSFWVKKDRTRLSHTRDRRLASEIPLSTLVAVDGLTSFGGVRRRCSKALRKEPIRSIESSASKRTSYNPWRHHHFHDFVFSTGPGLNCVTVRCLASCQRSATSPRKGTQNVENLFWNM